MPDIISLQNPHVKQIVKLRDDKRQRRLDGLMLVEGYDEIQLALSTGHQPGTLFSAPELVSRQIDRVEAESISVSRAVFEKMSYRENPDGWRFVTQIVARTQGPKVKEGEVAFHHRLRQANRTGFE